MNKSYYAIIPANVRYDKNIRDKAKLLYGEITALCNENGFCWATNEYFANLYGVSKTTISSLIKELVDNNYIHSEIIYKEGTKEILNRYLKIVKDPIKEILNTPIKENLKENNTYINNTSNKENINNNKLLFIKEKYFNEFWNLYPRKVEKKDCKDLFYKLNFNEEKYQIIINQLKRFKDTSDWKKQDGKFIPYPKRWLSKKRWEDEFETDTEKEERIEREIMEGTYGT